MDPLWISKTLSEKWDRTIRGPFVSVSVDSREIKPGALFVGVKTPTGHRQDYTGKAALAGAKAAIVEKFQPDAPIPQMVVPDSTKALQKLAREKRARYQGVVIGLTGSSGKTSTKELLAHLLGPEAYKTQGNLNNHLGVPLTILEAPLESPFWIMEAGISAPGEMKNLADLLRPNAGLITMIGSAHLEFFKTRDAIAAEKGKLLEAIDGYAVLHEADYAYPALKALKCKIHVLAADKREQGPNRFAVQETKEGWEMRIDGESYRLPLWTPGMIRNAGLCLALARHFGIEKEILQDRIVSWKGAPLRGEWLRPKEGPRRARVYLDAYNSNPEALADSLWRFHRMSSPEAPKLYVIGTMNELGEESDALHQEAMGKLGETNKDSIVLAGAKAAIMKDALKNSPAKNIAVYEKLDDVKSALLSFEGDIFVKGSHSTNLYKLSEICENCQ